MSGGGWLLAVNKGLGLVGMRCVVREAMSVAVAFFAKVRARYFEYHDVGSSLSV